MEEQPPALATHVAVGTGAEGVAAARLRLRREFPGLDVGAVELPQAGDLPPGTRAGAGGGWRAGGQRRLVAAAAPWVGTARPALPPPGSATAREPEPADRRVLSAGSPRGRPRHLA